MNSISKDKSWKYSNFIENKYFNFNKDQIFNVLSKNQIDEAEKLLDKNKNITKFLITLIRLYFNSGQSEKGNELLNKSRETLSNNSDFYN